MPTWSEIKYAMVRRAPRKITLLGVAQYLWRFKLTRLGKALVATGLFSAAMGSGSLLIPVYKLFVALFLLGGIALLVGLLYRPRFLISGRFPEQVTAGETIEGRFKLANIGRLPAFDVALGMFYFPDGMKSTAPAISTRCLKANQSVDIPLSLEVAHRGVYTLPPVRAFSTFPFGICRAGSAERHPGVVTILPRFHAIAALDIPISRRYQPGGLAMTSHVGDSTEYIGSRDYMPGDPQRKVDFRAWARLGTPVVKEFQEEYFCRVALVLDTYVEENVSLLQRIAPRLYRHFTDTGTKESTPYSEQLEAAISLSATLADVLARDEYVIDVFAAGPQLYTLRTGRHTNHFDHVMEILASVDVCRENPFGVITPALAEELNQISAVICILLDWDESRQRLLRAAVEAGCSIKILIVRDGETTLPLTGGVEFVSEVTFLTPAQVFQGEIDTL